MFILLLILWEGILFKLWIMKDYGVKKSWSALFTVGDPEIFSPLPKYRFPKDEVLFWCLDLQCSGLWPQADTFQNGFAFTERFISPKLLT